MKIIIKVKVEIDPDILEPYVEIHAPKISDELDSIIEKLESQMRHSIIGWMEDSFKPIEIAEIASFFAENKRVYCMTLSGEKLLVKMRLFELDNQTPDYFIRISNGEIINLRAVEDFEAGISGQLIVHLQPGLTTYVSRRYIKGVKERLGI